MVIVEPERALFLRRVRPAKDCSLPVLVLLNGCLLFGEFKLEFKFLR